MAIVLMWSRGVITQNDSITAAFYVSAAFGTGFSQARYNMVRLAHVTVDCDCPVHAIFRRVVPFAVPCAASAAPIRGVSSGF